MLNWTGVVLLNQHSCHCQYPPARHLSNNEHPQLLWMTFDILISLTFWRNQTTQISSEAGLINVLSALAQVENILCISSEVGNNYS